MSKFTVIWAKSWQEKPILQPDQCRHRGEDVLSINQRLVPRGAGRQIAMSGCVCMACGIDTTGNFTVVEALHLCMTEHGWNREAGLRLYDLAEAHKDELLASPAIPIWCLHAFGWSGKQIVDALNGGKLLPAQMSQAVEKLAAEVHP